MSRSMIHPQIHEAYIYIYIYIQILLQDGCICPSNMKCISDNAGQTNNYYCEEVTTEKEVDSYTDGKFDWEPKVYVSKEDWNRGFSVQIGMGPKWQVSL